tara:strand:+ start:876 stop:1073 length:198 start_codon:yes stop_codon:yes gene_type:complete
MKTETQTHVGRFHEFACYHSTNTQTLYLTADAAREFAVALLTVADDIDACKFTASTLETIALRFD